MSTRSSQQGFTLIEMIVSLAVFTFVITIAVGALLMLMAANKQLQGEQSVMTNLSFAMDAMTREIRTGTFYYCDSSPTTSGGSNIFNPLLNLDTILGNSVSDCKDGNNGSKNYHGLAFKEGGNSITGANQRILYYFDEARGQIFRRIGDKAPQSIVSSGIKIKKMEFFVTGGKKQSTGGGDIDDQPAVTIFIEASENGDTTDKSYYLQTTVTQRTLDL